MRLLRRGRWADVKIIVRHSAGNLRQNHLRYLHYRLFARLLLIMMRHLWIHLELSFRPIAAIRHLEERSRAQASNVFDSEKDSYRRCGIKRTQRTPSISNDGGGGVRSIR